MTKKLHTPSTRKIKRSHLEIINYLMDSRHHIEIPEISYDAVKISSQKFKQVCQEILDLYNKFVCYPKHGFLMRLLASLCLSFEIFLRTNYKVTRLVVSFALKKIFKKLVKSFHLVQTQYYLHRPDRHKAFIVATFLSTCTLCYMVSGLINNINTSHNNEKSPVYKTSTKKLAGKQDLLDSYLKTGKFESVVKSNNRISFITDVTKIAAVSPKESLFIINKLKKTHKISSGEDLFYIIKKYKVSLIDIIKENPDIDLSAIKPGEVITIPDHVDLNYASNFEKYVSSLTPTYKLASFSNSSGFRRDALANLNFLWPLDSNKNVSSSYGRRGRSFHRGIDILAPIGTPVKASKSGIIIFSGWESGYGNCIVIDHNAGIKTRYAHLSYTSVQAGQIISAGENIGFSGNTGMSTGPHLHYEVIKNGQTQDPLRYFEISSNS